MRRLLIVVTVLLFTLCCSVMAQGVEGQMMITGYGGWSMGFGEVFDDYDFGGLSYSMSAGPAFGGIFHYGIGEKLFIGGEVMFQSYKAEVEVSDQNGFVMDGMTGSSSEFEGNFLFNGLYVLSHEEEKQVYLMGGGGFYGDSDSEFGIHGGLAYAKQVSESIVLVGMPRVHMIFANDTMFLVQFAVGVQFGIGG